MKIDNFVVSVSGLTKRYGLSLAVNNVSFNIKKGEVVGFVGLNGAGKSTTINSMLGFLRPTTGDIAIFGQMIRPETAHQSHNKIGFAGGDMSLFGNLTGNQYFDFALRRYGQKDKTRLRELIKQFDPDQNKRIQDLSRGNKQKIALIAAFMASPQLVILDEPTSGLDPLMQQVFIELIREESARGTTVFMSSHYLNEVIDVCSRILLIRNGKLIKDIPTSDLIDGGGKIIRVVSKYTVTPPHDSAVLTQTHGTNGHELLFTYTGTAAKLQQWLIGIPNLIDFTVVDHTAEAAFDDLYALETSKENENV